MDRNNTDLAKEIALQNDKELIIQLVDSFIDSIDEGLEEAIKDACAELMIPNEQIPNEIISNLSNEISGVFKKIRETMGASIYETKKNLTDISAERLKNASTEDLINATMETLKINSVEDLSDTSLADLMEGAIKFLTESTTQLMSLPTIQTTLPTSHIMPNNALMNTMQEGIKIKGKPKPLLPIDAGEFDLVVANARKGFGEITALTVINYEDGENKSLKLPKKLSEYERQVSDAIISLWEQSQKDGVPPIFTPDMIYKAMPGGEGKRATPQQRGAITRTIEKLRRLFVTVDATEEMKSRKILAEGETFKINDYYLSAKQIECKVKNGLGKVTAYIINGEPIVLTYSRLTGQILTLSPKCISIKKVIDGEVNNEPVKMNVERQAITGYLLRQIAWIKYDQKHKKTNQRSDVITFDAIFNDVEITTDDKVVRRRCREFVFEVLEYEKAIGYISDYEKQKKGQEITGVRIVP